MNAATLFAQFSPDRPVPRLFTVAEAQATLPLVGRIARDMQALYVRIFDLTDGSLKLDIENDDHIPLIEHHEALVEELQEVGCLLKDGASGVVEFLTLHEGKAVELTWAAGEETVGHWHAIGETFRSRKPIDEAFERESATEVANHRRRVAKADTAGDGGDDIEHLTPMAEA